MYVQRKRTPTIPNLRLNPQQEESVEWNVLLRECKELGWRVTEQEASATCRFLDKDKDGTWMGALKLLRAPFLRPTN